MATSSPFLFSYTTKDLILYALSLGFGSDEKSSEEDLRFLYERHPVFSALPVFLLTFTFWSKKVDDGENDGPKNHMSRTAFSSRLPSFPPPLLASADVIPSQLMRDKTIDLSQYPLIHVWQSIVWDRSLPLPSSQNDGYVETTMSSKPILVQPKSMGTFVTAESKVALVSDGTSLCTMQMAMLCLNLPLDAVDPFDAGVTKLTTRPVIPDDDEEFPPLLEWTFATGPNQALLYRIASGDTNKIHVDTSAAEQMKSPTKAPLLHGLFTLGVAFRALQRVVPDADTQIASLEARFSQPAFVGDVLKVRIWKNPENVKQMLFVVENPDTGATVINAGCAAFRSDISYSTTRLRSAV